MRINHRIEIDLLDFVETGKLDYVTLGRAEKWMANNFPEPDYKHSFNKTSSCWGYGDIEIYFTKGEVSLISLKRIDTLQPGSHIELDKSIFANNEKCTLSIIQAKFNEHEIDYQVNHLVRLEQVIIKVLRSNVELGFGFHEGEIKKSNYELLFIQLASPSSE